MSETWMTGAAGKDAAPRTRRLSVPDVPALAITLLAVLACGQAGAGEAEWRQYNQTGLRAYRSGEFQTAVSAGPPATNCGFGMYSPDDSFGLGELLTFPSNFQMTVPEF